MKIDFSKLPNQEAIDELHERFGKCGYLDLYAESTPEHFDDVYAPGCGHYLWRDQSSLVWPMFLMSENHLKNSNRYLRGIKGRVDRDIQNSKGAVTERLALQQEELTKAIEVVAQELRDRKAEASIWNVLGDIKDWSVDGVDKIIMEQRTPFG